jgi:MFS family permease
MGIWGTFTSVGIGFGQIFASSIVEWGGLDGLFFVSAGLAIISGSMILLLKETLPKPQPFHYRQLKITLRDVVEPSVLPAAIVMFCQAISSGIVFVITSDISGFLEIENKGWFFGFYMLSTIVIRLFASGLSDVIGRRKTLIIGLSFMVASMVIIGYSTEWIMYTVGSILFGVATGVSSPTLFAWMADLSHHERRGVGAGTIFIALEVGIMVGSFSTILTYTNSISSIPAVFNFGAAFSLIAIIYLIWHLKYRHSHT